MGPLDELPETDRAPQLPASGTWDVLIVPSTGSCDSADREDCNWYLSNRFELTNQLRVGAVTGDRGERIDTLNAIEDACEPGGLNFKANRSSGTLYTLYCEMPAEPGEFKWDPDQRIQRAVAFSRLVRPTPLGFQYCARITFSDGKLTLVIPFPGARAWTIGGNEYLRREDWEGVKNLLAAWETCTAKDYSRITGALWYFEKTAREYYIEDRWELLARAVECLIGDDFNGTSKGGRGKRFIDGLVKLGEVIGHVVTRKDADRAWKNRSRVTHGLGLPLPSLAATGLKIMHDEDVYNKVEALLGSALRQAIQYNKFAQNFDSADAVARWLNDAQAS